MPTSQRRIDPKLLEILVCPLTRRPLRYDPERQELVSEQAGLAYPIRDGIPIMLVFTASDGTELHGYNSSVYTYQDNNQPLLSIQNNSLLGLNTYSTVIVNNKDFTDGCMSGDWTGNYINMTIRSAGFQAGENTPQVFYQLFSSGGSFQLNGFYSGSYHNLATGSLDTSGTHNYQLCAIGSTISVYKDGVLLASAIDSGITSSGYETFNQSDGNGNAILDNLAIVPTTVINEGDTYIKSGSFSDSDSSSWTATVNYGDGSGEQPLSLNGTSFSLNNHYSTQGLYIVTIKVTDNQNATGVLRATVKVNPAVTPTPTDTPTPTPVPNVAPAVGAITASANPIQVTTATTATASFSDSNPGDTHTAIFDWGDGMTSPGNVTENNGSGSVSGDHVYFAAGVYTITLTVTDNQNATGTSVFRYLSVYNPTPQGLFSGARLFSSPAGAYPAQPALSGQVQFGVTSKYQNGIPTGNVSMKLNAAGLTFDSTAITVLVTASGKATLRGTGIVNGAGNYNFLVTGIDGANDTIRFQITDPSSNDEVIYDSQLGAEDTEDPTASVTGQVIVH